MEGNVAMQYGRLGLLIVMIDSLVMCGYTLMAKLIRRRLVDPRFILLQNRVFGLIFIALALPCCVLKPEPIIK